MNAPNPSQFEHHRPLMFSIAYRMLGSATEAEDIVQEAYLRYQATTEPIDTPKAFLSTVVTRLCINHLQSAQTQRNVYVGPWLPEPILTDTDEQSVPVHQAELHESLSLAFLTLLEQLTPLERAVFLLREVFDYEYADIAGIIGKEEAACRQMFSRAKKHITEQRPRFKPTPEAHRQLLDTFIQATSTGDLETLMAVLSKDVTLWADGGGKARGAALYPLHGRERVGQFVLATNRLTANTYHIEFNDVNGETMLTLMDGNQVLVVLSVIGENGLVTEIRAIGNPDKLKWLNSIATKTEDSDDANEVTT
jgi:RNA polymerase sigma-70 factor, ECF subfamily